MAFGLQPQILATGQQRPASPPAPPLVPTAITVIDLDRTITRRGTYSPFLLYAARRYAPWRLAFVPAVLVAMAGYQMRLYDRRHLKELMHRLILGRQSPQIVLRRIAARYAEHVLRHNMHTHARDLIAAEQAAGRIVILATAAHRLYAEPIACHLGITDVVATESHVEGGRISCRVSGENCYGAAKLEAFGKALVNLGLTRDVVHVRFYSDDISDLPLFLACDEPVAVNPSRRLRRYAETAGWPIIELSH